MCHHDALWDRIPYSPTARVLILQRRRDGAYKALERYTAYAAEARLTARHRELPLEYRIGRVNRKRKGMPRREEGIGEEKKETGPSPPTR